MVSYVFLTLALAGTILFYFFRLALLGGLGVGLSLFGLVSWFHFRRRFSPDPKAPLRESVESKMGWFLLGLVIVGILILVFNVQQKGPEFYNGIAAGLVFTCAVAYVFELMLNWFSGFR